MLKIHREILKEFSEVGKSAKVILFGSFVRGDYRLDSDMDLAIITSEKSLKAVKERAERIANKILIKYGKVVSLKLVSKKDFYENKNYFVDEIKKGRVIYHGK